VVVVYFLEVVYVDNKEPELPVVSGQVLQPAVQSSVEQASVWKTGQVVRQGVAAGSSGIFLGRDYGRVV